MKKLKQSFALVLVLVLALSCLSVSTFAAETNSSKWEGWTPISNATELRNIENDMSGKYYLTNDITLSGSWTPIGGVGDNGANFEGTFDGNGHVISGLNYSNTSATAQYIGLFGTNYGTIQNVKVIVDYLRGYKYVGAVAGVNRGTIANITVEQVKPTTTNSGETASIIGVCNPNTFVGGIAGANYGTISNSEANVSVQGWDGTGIIAGVNASGTIEQCAARGLVNADMEYMEGYYWNPTGGWCLCSYVGGITGRNANVSGRAIVTDSYCDVTLLQGANYIGGFVGRNDSGCSITNTYCWANFNYDVNGSYNSFCVNYGSVSGSFVCTSGSGTVGGAKRVDTTILDTPDTFGASTAWAKAWDWENIWTWNEEAYLTRAEKDALWNSGEAYMYPVLRNCGYLGSVSTEPDPVNYTVTYVDGVENEEVFADQTFSVLEGSATPAFNSGDMKAVVDANGNPVREGYTFVGWNPTVAATVTGDVTYVAQWTENEKFLYVRDGMTNALIAKLNAEEVAKINITTLAYDLKVDAKTEGDVTYLFAGWFTAPQTANDWEHDSWASKSVAGKTLAADDSTIYAYYIDARYTNLTIAYTSNSTKATRTFMLSTVPGDIFNTYAHIMSTAASANNSNLFKGAVIDGLKANAIEKTTVYTNIAIAPFSAQSPKTANDFNGGLGGIYQNGTNGYISYTLITSIPVGKTVSVRPYYVTMEGTTIYGSTAQATIAANAHVTGLEG